MAGEVNRQLRASDADREKAVAELRVHHHAGRLDDDELEERVSTAYGAKTVGPLYDVLEDLPVVRVDAVEPIAPRVVRERGWGVRPFHQVHELPTNIGATWEAVVASLLPPLISLGFDLRERVTERGLVVVLGAERVTVELEPRRGGGTRLVAHGRARRFIRRLLAAVSSW